MKKFQQFFHFTLIFNFLIIILCDASGSNIDEECNNEVKNEFAFNYSIVLNSYGLNQSKFSGLPYFGFLDNSTTTFNGFADHTYPNINATKVQCGDIIFVRTDFISNFFNEIHPIIYNQYILITHNNDNPIGKPWHLKFLDSDKILGWFGSNVIGRHPKLKMLPIGLNPHNYSIIHQASHQNVKPFNERNVTLYLNFSPQTNNDRPAIINYVKQRFWGESDVGIVNRIISYDVYLSHLGNAKYTVSPPGYGLDCFRMWEAFIMRTIPIVLRNEISHLYAGLPVMFVDSWTDINRNNLEKFEQKYLKTFNNNGCPQDRPKIWARYWITKVMDFQTSSKTKFCTSIN